MKKSRAVPVDKKLTVIARIEPGSLGPDGVDTVEAFCRYANQSSHDLAEHFCLLQIIPRYDKTKPELEYFIQHKKLNSAQVIKYLGFFDKNPDDVEETFYAKLTTLIERFLAQK
ncbi:MAG: hypothetical protein ACI9FJ_002990 [Alteromonadaceae bacterium]|jgi:hypothetical protein